MKLARARQFIEAVAAHDFDAAEALLDPDVETVTPRDTFHGVAACRQVLQKASGDERFTMEHSEPEFEDVDGDVLARTREIARWRETGELAYEREVAVRLTLEVLPSAGAKTPPTEGRCDAGKMGRPPSLPSFGAVGPS